MRMVGRIGVAVVLGFALISAAAGCGGSAQPAAGSAPQQSGAPAPSSGKAGGKLTQVTLGKAVNVVSFNVSDIAQREGFFKQQGLTVKSIIMHGSSNANAALVGGSLQFTMADSIPLAIARSKGVPLVAIAGIDHGVNIQMIMADSWIKAHHLSASASLAARVRALEGSRMGHAGPTDLKLTDMLLQRYKVPVSSVKVESFSGGSAEAAALTHGAIDEFSISPPTSLQAAAQGHAQRWINFKNVSGLGHMEYDLVMTTTQYAKSHPKIVKAMATAIAEADNFLLAHPAQALKVEESLWPKIGPQVLKPTLGLISWDHNGMQSAKAWSEADSIINGLGFVKGKNFKAVEGVDWTNQYINQAALTGK